MVDYTIININLMKKYKARFLITKRSFQGTFSNSCVDFRRMKMCPLVSVIPAV